MRNIDIWKTDREQAHTMPCGLKVLRRTAGRHPVVLIWRPRATKPYAHSRFRSVADRQQYVQREVTNFKAAQKLKESYKQERKGTPEALVEVKPGTIFVCSWGYDQTNVDFYQVVERHGRQVTLREIGQESVPGSEGFMCDSRLPKRDVFLEKPALKKLVQFHGGSPSISMTSYSNAYLWDGNPQRCSWYG